MGTSKRGWHPNRRQWIGGTAGVLGVAGSRWMQSLAAADVSMPSRARPVILLWMNGGPATIDLWDLKPGHQNGGPFQEIATTVPGVKVSEHLPRMAQWGTELAIVRSMSSGEGDHGRARQYVHTGYTPQPAIRFPLLGSLVAKEFYSELSELPGFVSITPERALVSTGSGFLGPKFAPLAIGQLGDEVSGLVVPNIERHRDLLDRDQTQRLSLLQQLNQQFINEYQSEVASSMRTATEQAVRLMEPAAADTFRIDRESVKTREAYGPSTFGQGCLLARRLVERGVRFVEVSLDGWDTHSNNFERVMSLSQVLDQAFSALLSDLNDRGLLDSTLVICQGEFGRTPRINGNTGRDHWPGAWATVLAGGGVRGGQVIGATSEDGTTVESEPTTVPDLIATVCSLLGIDPMKQNNSNVGRPIRIADPDARVIGELV